MKKIYRVIKFNQKAWLKSYIELNIQLRKKAKNDFERDFFQADELLNSSKNHGKYKKHRDIGLVITESQRNYLVSIPNFHSTIFFTENLLAIEMRKTQILINRPVYLCLSILKILTYEFWYDSVKPKYGEKTILYGYKKVHCLHKNGCYL